MKQIKLSVFALPLVLPLNFYPEVDFFKQFSGLFLSIAMLVFAVCVSDTKIRVSRACFLWLLIGSAWLASYLFSSAPIKQPSHAYAVFWACGMAILVAVPTVSARYGREAVIRATCQILWITGLLTAAIGLVRYYGLLKLILPWVSVDGNRLIGPLGQPNLTGVVLALAAAAFLYLGSDKEFYRSRTSWLMLAILCYAGVLTGSRAWLVMMALVVLSPFMTWLLDRMNPRGFRSTILGAKRSAGLAALFLALIVIAPITDKALSQPLIDSGFLHRESADEMLSSRMKAEDAARTTEWWKVINNVSAIDNLLTGIGPGYYASFSTEAERRPAAASKTESLWTHPHNLFLLAIVEWGLIGLIVILCVGLYLFWLFLKPLHPTEKALFLSVIGSLIFHNLVEYSLWYYPFLAIFLTFFALFDRDLEIKFSSLWLPRSLAVAVTVVTLLLSVYVVKDYLTLSRLAYKENLNTDDQYALQDVGRSSLIGDGALKLAIYRLSPPLAGLEHQLSLVNRFIEWRPDQLFLIRAVSLTAALGDKEGACEQLTFLVRRFPAAVSPVQSELRYFEANGFDIASEYYAACILEGVSFWTRP